MDRVATIADSVVYDENQKTLSDGWSCQDGVFSAFWVKGQNVCLARRVAGVRFGLFECRLS
ncbi:hypothetical protein QP923_08590, partial [Corynebacterium sp. MSK151]|uniref:hypothetical protein n=1 Tax=Corynebacterium sp. MSK047 TaxID=3050196 RepID=UPI0025505C3C